MRRVLVLAAAVVVAFAAILLLLRQSLVREELRQAVESKLSATLGEPVAIGELAVAFFPRPSVSGANVRVGDADLEAPSIQIERVRILPRLRSLLSGPATIDLVELDGFVASILHDETGWHLPSAAPAPGGTDGGPLVIDRVRVVNGRVRIFDRTPEGLSERSSIDGIEAEIVSADGGLMLSPISGQFGSARISGTARVDPKTASLDFTSDQIADADLPALLRMLGSDRPDMLRLPEPATLAAALRIERSTSYLSGTGTLRAPSVTLDPLRLHRFEAPFVIDGQRLTFAPATFELYGGAHDGKVGVTLAAQPPAWTIDSRVTGLNVGAFLTALNGRDQRLDGTAALTASLQGRVGEALTQSVRGRARAEVTGGVIRDFPLLAFVNRTLRLAEPEGSDTRFERLTATLQVAAGGATTDDLLLVASHLRVEAAGRINADRSLGLKGIAAISPERSAAAISSIRELKGLRNARGEVEVPLTITGTLDAPSFALDVESALKKGIMDELRRRLRRIIK